MNHYSFYQPYSTLQHDFSEHNKENLNILNLNNSQNLSNLQFESNHCSIFPNSENIVNYKPGDLYQSQFRSNYPDQTFKKSNFEGGMSLESKEKRDQKEYKKFIETINRRHVDQSIQASSFISKDASHNIKSTFRKESSENTLDSTALWASHTSLITTNSTLNKNTDSFVTCEDNTRQKKRKALMEIDSGSTLESLSHHSNYSNSENGTNNITNNLSKNKNNSLINSINEIAYCPLYARFYSAIPHDYLLEIWETLKSEEQQTTIDYHFIQSQKDINDRMRAILVDWIVDVHSKFNLKDETLFLTVNIIDRYISCKPVLRSKLQLIGVSALMIACKYEEILCPDIRDFVFVTDKTYTKQEILAAEKEILHTMQFNVTVPSPLRFFEIISLNFNFSEVEFTYGNYLLQTFLIDCKINRYSASLIALAAAYIVMKINYYSNYKDLYNLFNTQGHVSANTKILKDCAKDVYFLVENVDKFTKLQAVFNKFATLQNFMVSTHGMGTKCVKRY